MAQQTWQDFHGKAAERMAAMPRWLNRDQQIEYLDEVIDLEMRSLLAMDVLGRDYRKNFERVRRSLNDLREQKELLQKMANEQPKLHAADKKPRPHNNQYPA